MSVLAELRDVLGEIALIRFLAVFAGTAVTVTKHPRGPVFDEIERVIGREAHDKLREQYAGSQLYVPLMAAYEREKRDAEIRARLAGGESPKAIAKSLRTARVTVRHIYRIAKLPAAG